ncbi:MAG: preprotein translocase subunit SecY [Thermoplasmata archaeon]|nr:MAG: preprotein translocase subunit SecY [Thermoplasmata archaeon]
MADIERNTTVAIPVIIVYVAITVFYSYTNQFDPVISFIFAAVMAPLFGLLFLMLSYTGEGSKLLGLKPVTDRLPAVKKPEGHVHFRTKMMWTLLILIVYFIMTNVFIYGIDKESTLDLFSEYRAIMAGASGSLMHLGIGPIVTGSIIMQLFTGAKIIKLDLTKPEDKAIYQGTQKLLVIVMIIVEAVPQVYGYLKPDLNLIGKLDTMTGGYGELLAKTLIVLQLCVGSYLVFFMDEVVSKWGIGSGISLFIAAGVSQAIFTGTISWIPTDASKRYNIAGAGDAPSGAIPKTFYLMGNSNVAQLSQGRLETILLGPPNPIIALVGTIVIFLVVAYAESSRVELPLAHGRVRGARGRYPIRLIYASNIPVILMAAVLANVNMFSLLLWSHPTASKIPLIGNQWWIGGFTDTQNPTQPTMGGAYYVSRVNGVSEWFLPLMNPDRYGAYMRGHEYWQVAAHTIIYFSVMVIGSIIFAKFWIDTTNMGPEAVAKQIQDSGMQIPGFRRDPRVLKKVLERYIPVVTIISGAFVGGLAALADMVGTVGNTSGTGVLLTVGIVIRLYEDIGREQLIEMHPVLRGFFGGE